MAFDQRAERGGGKMAVRHPGRQMILPDEIVAAQRLLIGGGERRHRVGGGPVKDALRGLDGLPLHGVFRSDRTELAGRQIPIDGVGEEGRIERRAEIAMRRRRRRFQGVAPRLRRRGRRGEQRGDEKRGAKERGCPTDRSDLVARRSVATHRPAPPPRRFPTPSRHRGHCPTKSRPPPTKKPAGPRRAP